MTPHDHLRTALRDHPGISTYETEFRAARGRDLPNWPDWCYAPLAAAMAVASKGGEIRREHAAQVARIGALAAWKARPLVWRDAAPVGEMPPYAALRPLLLERLPRWCTWIAPAEGRPGAFVHLEHDVNDGRVELRLALDLDGQLVGVPIHLDHGSLSAALDAALAESVVHAGMLPSQTVQEARAAWRETLGAYLPLVTRLAAEPALATLEPPAPASRR